MHKDPLPPSRQRLFAAIVVLGALLVGFVLIEISYRAFLYYTFTVKADYQVVTADTPLQYEAFGGAGSIRGIYKPNTIYSKTQYVDDVPVRHNKARINNFGWVSQYDYSRNKSPDEYRIAIVGDSLTASTENDQPWPDILQAKLNADAELLQRLAVNRISVLNLGINGASMQKMANPAAVVARRYSADLIIVNFVTEDLGRRNGGDIDLIPNEPRQDWFETDKYVEPQAPDISIDGVEIRLLCPSGIERSLSDQRCKIDTWWFVPPTRKLSKEELRKIKQTLAQRALMQRVVLSWRPQLLMALSGKAGSTGIDQTDFLSSSNDEDFDIALKAFRYIARLRQWELLITHNPLYWTLNSTQKPEVLERFIKQASEAGFPVQRMEEFMPVQRGEREWYRWYNLPYDGHWSDHGAEVYGEAMHRVVRRRLLAKHAASAPGSEACASSYESFSAGRASLSRGHLQEAYRAFQASRSSLPSNALTIARQPATTYSNCGFLLDLYIEQAALHESQGETQAAESVWKLALSLDATQAFYERRLAHRRAYKNNTGALADLSVLIQLNPGDPNFLVARGDMLLAFGDAVGALKDFTEALSRRHSDVSLLFRSSQARMILKDWSGAISDTDRAIVLTPSNANLFLQRATAKAQLGQFEDAVADYTKAIDLQPKESAFYMARSNVLVKLGREPEAARDRQAASRISK